MNLLKHLVVTGTYMSKTFSSHWYIHMSEVFNNTEKCSQKFFTSQKNFKLFWYYHEKPAVKIYKEKYVLARL